MFGQTNKQQLSGNTSEDGHLPQGCKPQIHPHTCPSRHHEWKKGEESLARRPPFVVSSPPNAPHLQQDLPKLGAHFHERVLVATAGLLAGAVGDVVGLEDSRLPLATARKQRSGDGRQDCKVARMR